MPRLVENSMVVNVLYKFGLSKRKLPPYICMYVRMHAYMYICMYMYVCTYTYVCLYSTDAGFHCVFIIRFY